jgi:glycosyltransferase involved in cell wall biosynthesis
MRLLLFTHSFPFRPGEEFLESEITYLDAAFSSVTVVPLKISDDERDVPSGVNVDVSLARILEKPVSYTEVVAELLDFELIKFVALHGIRNLFDFKYLKKVVSHWRQANQVYKWLSSNSSFQNTTGLVFYTYWFDTATTGAALFSQRKYRSRIFTRCHNFDLYSDRVYKGIFPFREFALEQIDGVFPCSENGRSHLSDSFRQWKHKYATARLGVRKSGDNPWVDLKKTVRICSCAYVVEVKRLHLLATALQIAGNENPGLEFKWTHFGDGPLLADLKDMISNAPPNVQVDFRGATKNVEVLKTYSKIPFDVFVNCSRSEGLPVSIMEAMSFGIPVVATDVGGVPELVNGENGVLLERDCSPHQIAEAIFMVKSGKEKMRSSAERSFRSLVDADANYSEFASILSEAADR